MAKGHFDADSEIDLAVAFNRRNFGSPQVQLIFNPGDGQFTSEPSNSIFIPLEDNVIAMEAGDLDKDGDTDIVIAYEDEEYISVYLSDGTRQMTESRQLATHSGNEKFVLQDLNSDNYLDLAITNSVENTITILWNNGTGDLIAKPISEGVFSIVTEDFNGDGNIDLAIGEVVDDAVWIYLGDNDGNLTFDSAYPVDFDIQRIAAGDLDVDGSVDIVVAGTSRRYQIFLNTGSGGFVTEGSETTGTANYHLGILIDDIDNDDLPDLVLTGIFHSEAYLLKNLGRIGNGINFSESNYRLHSEFGMTRLVDLNGDGFLDLAGTSYDSSKLRIGLNDQTGSFHPLESFDCIDNGFGLIAIDFDTDSDMDIVVVSWGSSLIEVSFNNGSGEFNSREQFDTGIEGISLVEVADIDNDGDKDLICWGDELGTVLNNGDGTFSQGQIMQNVSKDSAIAINDLNHDGYLDVSASSYEHGTVMQGLNLGNGVVEFLGGSTYMSIEGAPVGLAVGDFNNDLLMDIAVGTRESNRIAILEQQQNKFFAESATFDGAVGVAENVAAVDANQDGLMDLVAGLDQIQCFMNLGGFTFSDGAQLSDNPVASFAVGDVNGDGYADLVSQGIQESSRNTGFSSVFASSDNGLYLISDLKTPEENACWLT